MPIDLGRIPVKKKRKNQLIDTLAPAAGPLGMALNAFFNPEVEETASAEEPTPMKTTTIEEPAPAPGEKLAEATSAGGGGSLKSASSDIGKGLGQFFSAMGMGATSTPIDMTNRGWESNLGGTIGAKVGSAAINSVLFGSKAGRAAGLGATPTMYNTASDKAKNVFSQMDVPTYQALQADLMQVPEAVLTDVNQALPYYRALLMKYPSAKSFLSEYFGLTRNYNYNFPQGLPAGKYNLGGAAAVGEE